MQANDFYQYYDGTYIDSDVYDSEIRDDEVLEIKKLKWIILWKKYYTKQI